MTAARLATDVFVVSVQIAWVIVLASVLALVVRIDAAGVRYQFWRGLLVFCLALPWIQPRRAMPGLDARSFTFPSFSFSRLLTAIPMTLLAFSVGPSR